MVNSLSPRWSKYHFADDFFKCIFLNKDVLIVIEVSLKFIPKGPIDDIMALAISKWQSIVWTNDYYYTVAYMCHSASMS